jgi:hypothetical protein
MQPTIPTLLTKGQAAADRMCVPHRFAYSCCCSSTKQSASSAIVIRMRKARTSSSMIASRREACAHTFQRRVSGSLSELTRLRFVRRVVKAVFRFSAGSNRVVAGVKWYDRGRHCGLQILVLKLVRRSLKEPDEELLSTVEQT